MSLGHFIDIPVVYCSSVSFSATASICEIMNCRPAVTNAGYSTKLNSRFCPLSLSQLLPRCPFPACWNSAVTVVKSATRSSASTHRLFRQLLVESTVCSLTSLYVNSPLSPVSIVSLSPYLV